MYCACFRGDVGVAVFKTRREARKVCFLIESLSQQKLLCLLMSKKCFLFIRGFKIQTASIHRVFVVIVAEVSFLCLLSKEIILIVIVRLNLIK